MSDTASNQLITQADRSIKAISAATAALAKVVNDLLLQTAVSEGLAADIQQKESQLNDLDRDFDARLRTYKANLQISVLENEREVLHTLLRKNGMAAIADDELSALRTALETAKLDNTAAIEAAVKTASATLHAKYSGELASLKSTHQVEQATATANLAAAGERINFLAGEIENLRRQVESERLARIEIAKADAQRQGVTVNAGKQ